MAKVKIVVGAETKEAKRKLKELGVQTKKVSTGFKGFAKSVLGSRFSILALTAAVGFAIRDFAKFEKKMVDVGNLFDATTAQVKGLSDEVLAISTRVPQAAQDLANALFDVVSAGVAVGDATKFLETSAKLAVAGVTDTKTAVDGLTTVINAYSLAASDAEIISDKFFAAQVLGKTTIAELSFNIGRLAPIARSAGVGIDDLLAGISALTTKGIKTEEAVVALRGAFNSIIKPTEDSLKLAKSLGVEFNVQALEAKGLAGFLKDVQEATGGNVELMAQLFPNVRALTGVLALASDGFVKLEEGVKKVSEAVGTTDKAFQKQLNTLSGQFKLLSNNVLTASKSIVGFFDPALKGTLKAINNLFVRVKDFKGQIRETFDPTTIENVEIAIEKLEEKIRFLQKAQEEGGFLERRIAKKRTQDFQEQIMSLEKIKDAIEKETGATDDNTDAKTKASAAARKLAAELAIATLKSKKLSKEFIELRTSFKDDLVDLVVEGNLTMGDAFENLAKRIQRKLVDEALTNLALSLTGILTQTEQVDEKVSGGKKKKGPGGNIGTVIGGVVGGPIGSVIGGFLGGLFGSEGGIVPKGKQLGSKLPKFQGGGVVSGGATTGDQIPARLNAGEMVLNQGQQGKLFSAINGGGGGGQQVTINFNNGIFMADRRAARELAKMIDDELVTMGRTGQRVSF